MPSLVFRAAAVRELADIAAYIERESGSRDTAETFAGKVIAYCEKLAGLPALMGRPRPELRPGIRSVTFATYVIFLRYEGELNDPNCKLYVSAIVHGRRDLDAYFSEQLDEDESA